MMYKRKENNFTYSARNASNRNTRQKKNLWLVFFVIEFYFIVYYYRELQFTRKGQEDVEPPFLDDILSQSTINAILLRGNKITDPVPPAPLPPEYPNIPERGYPKLTHLVDYTTSATEAEIEKHDRLLVQSLFNFHLGGPFIRDPSTIKSYTPTRQHIARRKLCLNIYLCNRRVPYINAMLTSLTSHSTKESREEFLEKVEVHLLNTEKRPERIDFRLVDEVLGKLPFVHEIHNVTYRDLIYKDQEEDLDFREQFISDQLSGLNICIDSKLPYCIMMEEDAVVPVDFVQTLWEQVIEPLERDGLLDGDSGNGKISLVSLYAYHNLVFFGDARLHYASYSRGAYNEERSKSNTERGVEGLPRYEAKYKVKNKDYMYGTVAMLYTRESALKLITYLRMVGVDPRHNADEFMNADHYFPRYIGAPRKDVEPSLVNHIGFYSERMADKSGMFSQLNTDARFTFDAGSKEEL
mmetsp:Transcript_34512/g.41285  ORF Transcript_34512/g.41285 Transcript_34512/m.41285 type:complete len:467 (+) Transcript_34512:39-1439(+)